MQFIVVTDKKRTSHLVRMLLQFVRCSAILQRDLVACFRPVIMVALWNRADHYIFMLWFVLFSSIFLFFPRLISAAADWMSAILPHMVWP